MLATTRNYLMVLKTTYKDPKSGKELCGFTSKMGTNAPAPRLLRLKTGAWGPRLLAGASPLEEASPAHHTCWADAAAPAAVRPPLCPLTCCAAPCTRCCPPQRT